MITTLLAIVLAVIAGVPLTLRSRHHFTTRSGWLATASLIGAGLEAATLFLLSVLGIRWSPSSFVIALCGITAVMAWLTYSRRTRGHEESDRTRLDWLGWIATAVIVATLSGYALYATVQQPIENDYLAIWGLKARVFFEHGGVDWSFLKAETNRFAHVGYPLLLPLLFDSAWVLGGQWLDRWVGLYSIFFGICSIALFREGFAGSGLSRGAAAVATVAMTPLLLSPWIGLGEAPMIAFGAGGVVLLHSQWRRSGTFGAPVAILFGLAASTKNEGISFLAALLIAFAVHRRWKAMLSLWPAFAIAVPWIGLRTMMGLTTDLAEGSVTLRVVARLAEPWPIIEALLKNPTGNAFFWCACLVAIAWCVRRSREAETLVLVVALAQVTFFLSAYLVTPHDVFWHIRWSWERILSQIAPLFAYVALLLLAQRSGLLEGSGGGVGRREVALRASLGLPAHVEKQ